MDVFSLAAVDDLRRAARLRLFFERLGGARQG
jgi:hypothetical protein